MVLGTEAIRAQVAGQEAKGTYQASAGQPHIGAQGIPPQQRNFASASLPAVVALPGGFADAGIRTHPFQADGIQPSR